MSNATPFDKAPVAQTGGEMPSCSTREGDADRTFSLRQEIHILSRVIYRRLYGLP